MNVVDLLILAALLWFVYQGAQTGLGKELVGLTGWLLAAVLALKFGGRAGAMAAGRLPQVGSLSNDLVGFFIVLIAVHLGFRLVSYMLKKMLDGEGQSTLDRLGGGIIGFIKGALIVSIVALGLHSLRLGARLEDLQNQSSLFPHMAKFAQMVVNQVISAAPAAADAVGEEDPGEPPGR